MPLQPLEDRVIIEPDPAPTDVNGILVPDTAKEKLRPAQGTIIAVGPGKSNDPVLSKILWVLLAICKFFKVPVPDRAQEEVIKFVPGERVMHGKYAGVPHEVDGKEVLIMRVTDLIAKL